VTSGARGGFGGPVVRDHRGGGAPVVSGARGGFGGARGTVVRDHRYGGTTVSVRPTGAAAASTRISWPYGSRGWKDWRGRGGWGGWRGPGWGGYGGGWRGYGGWGRYGSPSYSDYYPSGWRRTGYWQRWPWLQQGASGFTPSPVTGGFAPSTFVSGFAPQPVEGAAADPQIVAWAQACLAQVVGAWVPQDGNLSRTTQRAIQIFQTQTQLPPNGALDDNTLIALQQVCQQAPAPGGAAGPPAPQGGVSVSPPSDASSPPPGAMPSPQSEAFEFAPEFGEAEFYEMEAPSAESDLIAFKIPDAPYSDKWFEGLHKAIDAIKGVSLVVDIFGPSLAGLLSIPIGALAAVVGNLLALGGAVAGGRAAVSRERIRVGFAKGVVMGAAGRKWRYVKDMFWEGHREDYRFDWDAGTVAQKAFNTGLAAGFLQGREIAKYRGKQQFFWDSIRASLTRGDQYKYGGDQKLWPPGMWIDWYSDVAGKFIAIYLKD
jgi:hypothetical protein